MWRVDRHMGYFFAIFSQIEHYLLENEIEMTCKNQIRIISNSILYIFSSVCINFVPETFFDIITDVRKIVILSKTLNYGRINENNID